MGLNVDGLMLEYSRGGGGGKTTTYVNMFGGKREREDEYAMGVGHLH